MYTDPAESVIIPGWRQFRVREINWAVFYEERLLEREKSQPVLEKKKER